MTPTPPPLPPSSEPPHPIAPPPRGEALTAEALRAWLHSLAGMPEECATEVAVQTAEALVALAEQATTNKDRAHQSQLQRLMADDAGKTFTAAMADQVFRAAAADRAADQLRHLVDDHGLPAYFTPWERTQLAAFRGLSPYLPRLLVPAVRARVRHQMRDVLVDGDPDPFERHLALRRAEGVRVNLNHLGESILSEAEAERRLEHYLEAAKRSDVASLSIKASSIASHLEVLAWDHTVERLAARVRRLYRAAQGHPYVDGAGAAQPKWIMLDMEEYRDLGLTTAVFRQILDEPEFSATPAGLVLQAYLPDAHPVQRDLTAWAQRRVDHGGHPIRLRLVKGANLAMEQVEASMHGWSQAPYLTKADVDANYKRMLDWGIHPGHTSAVHLGVASHNLFDVAYALVLRAMRRAAAHVEFEMLEGMAEPIRRAVQDVAGGMLVYAPAVRSAEMQSAIAYLLRRLDENTSPENFLRHSFGLAVGSGAWEEQRARFEAAVARRHEVAQGPRRQQDRRAVRAESPPRGGVFANEPDTDWTLPHHRAWIATIAERWRTCPPLDIPLLADPGRAAERREVLTGVDPSIPGRVLYRAALATWGDLDAALDRAVAAAARWGATGLAQRQEVLLRAAQHLRAARGELIGAMMADGAKAIRQADPEVSEAVDFAEYYARSLDAFAALPDVELAPRGVVLVAPPWNFPLAIPAGGVLAALAAGNAVILKPAPPTALVGVALCQVLWQAGVERDVVQCVICADDPEGSRLVEDQRIAAAVLTGGTSTARLFGRLRPTLPLFAETGGKNAMIVTDLADRDLAIASALQSAFGHSGQKCSATSLLVCEANVYDDEGFRARLRDAALSLPVGSAWEPASVVTPLIQPPEGDLLWALTSLDDGEEWLVAPRPDPHNPRLWSPGIKLGVRPHSRSHLTEFFGPIVSVMRADDLEDAIQLANAVPYGLTSGLQSLDTREQARWAAAIDAGNLYVNRGTTGAIVRRQPFGGRKASSFGPGAKAGGPNYTLQLTQPRSVALPPKEHRAALAPAAAEEVGLWSTVLDAEQTEQLRFAAESATYWWAHEFGRAHDPSGVLGEDNHFRYQAGDGTGGGPGFAIILRASKGADPFHLAVTHLAATVAHATIHWSVHPAVAPHLPAALRARGVEEAGDQLAARLATVPGVIRVRVVGTTTDALDKAAHALDLHVASAPVLLNGRIEMLHYLREQSLTTTVHRYGNLGPREGERRPQP